MSTEAGLPAEAMTDLPRLRRPEGTRAGVGIVHLGLGAFFRAHGALYIEEAMGKSGGDWGIVGVSLRSPGQRDKLKPQDFTYTCLELGPDGPKARVAGVVQDILVAPESPEAVIAAITDPSVRIVTLTITEKGYCHFPASGRLNTDHPDIRHDIAQLERPKSAPGFIVRALQVRRENGVRPFTVLCCDNLPSNGRMLRSVVIEFARQVDDDLAGWIERECTFPCTMVDRIVPATTEADIERVGELTGNLDMSPVIHEPFRQWVIEDDFIDGARPDFASVGVEMTDNVEPYEVMKLRCLNGTHSSLAYLGYLAGHETIAETVEDDRFAAYVRYLWDEEIIPSFEAPRGTDIHAYADALLERYRNPSIRHRTWQIAMDGSQKLPQRILGTVADNLRDGRAVDGLCLAIAAWMRYVGGTDEEGEAIDVRDPLADRLRSISDGAATAEEKVAVLLDVQDVFPAELASDGRFRETVTRAYLGLVRDGAAASVAGFADKNG